jgi:hypothetical protein
VAVIAAKQLRGVAPFPNTVGITRSAAGAQPMTTYRFLALMDAVDIADPTIVIPTRLFLDAKKVYDQPLSCGVRDRRGNFQAPSFEISTSAVPPANYRVEVDLPRALNIGLDVTLVAPV